MFILGTTGYKLRYFEKVLIKSNRKTHNFIKTSKFKYKKLVVDFKLARNIE